MKKLRLKPARGLTWHENFLIAAIVALSVMVVLGLINKASGHSYERYTVGKQLAKLGWHAIDDTELPTREGESRDARLQDTRKPGSAAVRCTVALTADGPTVADCRD